MRIVPFIISTVVTVALVFALDKRWGSIPALGKFLSPQTGFWQNAEAAGERLDETFSFKNLKGKVAVHLDERLVPHVFADQDEDVYFVQGFLHAKYRLWQMDFNARAAAGRLSEIVDNEALLNYDRLQRRSGMVFAAENMLAEIKKDAFSQKVLNAYTAGVNACISTLTESTLPLEFKLLGYKPEAWTNLKSALFVKLMSADLAGMNYARDIPFTNMKTVFSREEMNLLFPQISDSSQPIIPPGTFAASAAVIPAPPPTVDSLYYGNDSTLNPPQTPKVTDITGSNNWAVSGSKTASGAPILCNDPHLRLTLPSIWFEMQLTTPTMNVYGASFASIPGVVIGFNDNVAFGVTNAGRDVIDYFRIRFKDDSRREYWYNGAWTPAQMRKEEIKRLNGSVYVDEVAYTVFGPVLYDKTFNNGDSTLAESLAMRWTAHDPSNELLTWIKLDRAKSHADYLDAMQHMRAPAQNFVFAAKNGDIAIGQFGRYPLRWPGQGLYVMPGEDSSYAWQGWIPSQDVPHVLNPPQGFVQSANQRAVDSTYPYFIPGDYITPRGVTLHNKLAAAQGVTVDNMKRLQNDAFSSMAASAIPFLLQHTDEPYLNESELAYLNQLKTWDYNVSANATAPTIYQAWFDSLEKQVWSDEFAQLKKTTALPDEETLFEALRRDTLFRFIDNITTAETETLNQQVTTAFKLAAGGLAKEEKANELVWWKHKGSAIQHSLRDALKPFGRYDLPSGGWGNVLHAHTKTNGPSWRMIVHLTAETEAWGIYPAGQSGNPGSPFYDNFVDDWVAGRYYRLWVMKASEAADKRIIGTLTFTQG
ncbi:MAG TPA: penicillin acylase family protein [Flavisolibacter sp.]